VVRYAALGCLLVTLVVSVTGHRRVNAGWHSARAGAAFDDPADSNIFDRFIELWRGVPLITVLFFATYMLPLFCAVPGSSVDGLMRALIGIALFAGALPGRGHSRRPGGDSARAGRSRERPWPLLVETTGLIVMPRRCATSSRASSIASSRCSRTFAVLSWRCSTCSDSSGRP